MRLLPLAASVCVTTTLLTASVANAADEDLGTRPAQSAPVAVAPAAPPAAEGEVLVAREASDSPRHYRATDAAIAKDPPGDWYFLYGGLRPHLGTFGGIATFALAHARTERFYGGLSL